MQQATKPPLSLRIVGMVVFILGLVMVVYWAMFLAQGMPVGDIPVLSEAVTAVLALVAGVGLLLRKAWAVPCTLVLAGMWAYGVIGGIALVLRHGLAFDSPFGARVDALLFPLILLFAVYLAVLVWRQRTWFA
jgi:hypothetical protein